MTCVGIREFRTNLSRYVRHAQAGERIAVTVRGRVVAELVARDVRARDKLRRFDELISIGVIRPPLELGDPTEDWPDIRLPRGTAAKLIDVDREEATQRAARSRTERGNVDLRSAAVPGEHEALNPDG